MKKARPTFSAEFMLESAELVVEQHYTLKDAAEAMVVGLSTMGKWVKQPKDERRSIAPRGGLNRLKSKNQKNGSNTSKREKTY